MLCVLLTITLPLLGIEHYLGWPIPFYISVKVVSDLKYFVLSGLKSHLCCEITAKQGGFSLLQILWLNTALVGGRPVRNTEKTYKLLFFYFLLNGRKIHAELLIEILVPTQIVCWSQEKSLSSSHKYFLLQIFGNFKQINSSIGLLENCLSNLLIFFRIHLRSGKKSLIKVSSWEKIPIIYLPEDDL